MKKILIFEPNSNQALSMAKYIKKYSNYYIVGVVEKEIRFNRESYDEVIIEEFLNINIDKYNYILPMGAGSTFAIVKKYQKLIYANEIFFSSKNLIVFDKPKMLKIAQNIDVPIPKTFYSIENIEHFPIYYKENFENGGGVRGIAKATSEIPEYSELIYQEYIDTPFTYGVGFLAKGGEIIASIQHKEVLSYPKDGGSAVVIESYENDKLFLYTKKLLNEVDYNGWGLAEFKYCNKRDDFVFMEINAKFWASIEFTLKNNPLFLKKLLEIQYQSKKENSMLFINRIFQYDFVDIVKKFSYFWGKNIIKESPLVYQIVRKIIPNGLVENLKRIWI